MSEAVTTSAPSAPSTSTASPSTQSAPSTATPASAQAPTGQGQAESSGASTNSHGVATSGERVETPAQTQARKLGAQDMDALVEIKINGQVQEVPLKEAIKLSQLEKASKQKINEAQRLEAQHRQLMELAKSDPERYMKDVLGLDPKAWAEERLAREYELQQMSPEARKAMELEQQVQEFKSKDLKAKEPLFNELKGYMSELPKGIEGATLEQIQGFVAQKRAEFQAGQAAIENEIVQAWESHGLPKEKDFGTWMAQEMIAHKKRTGEDLAATDAAAKVKNRFIRSTKSIFGKMDAKAIQDVLGKEIVDKLRAYDVEQVSRPQTPPWASNGQQTLKQHEVPQKGYMTETEYREWLKRPS